MTDDSNQSQDQADSKQEKHRSKMQKMKASVDARIEAADTERGVLILLTGNGKGKSSSAFGMVMRSLGYQYKVGVVQFIKGKQLSGEELYLRELAERDGSNVTFYQMGTGFTWNTQDRSGDIAAAERTWEEAAKMLGDDSYHLVVLDELTYMLSFKYLDEETVLAALKNRPANQSVVVTGRGGGAGLIDIADTVTELKDVKHAFKAGIKARQGVDF